MIDKNTPILTDLSHELICHILQYLPLQDVLSVSMLCKKLLDAVSMHLRLCKSIDFCEGKIYGYMPSSITDDHMHCLFDKCPNLETVYGLHPLKVERRRLRKRSALTVPGIIEALSLCHNLKSVETSDLRLLEAIMQHLPQIKIIGHFQNRDGIFPPQASHRLKLLHYPRISSLHLIGVEVPELTAMPHLEHLHLQCVRFTKLQPFRAFLASKLKTFVMKHCMGPTLSLRYLSLIIALSSAPSLTRLELVRVPLPGGLFQRAVEDSFRHNGFVNLKTLVISGCKGVMEADLGHLMIVASKNLERVFIQPSLTRDSLFVSLSFAQCEFPKLQDIHLGYVDKLDFTGSWSNDSLVSLGLAEVPDTPSSLTDSGMKVISELFPHIKRMSVSNCPHLMLMDQWSVTINGQIQGWRELTDLTLQRCHCLQLLTFTEFLERLPKIEVVILNDMFREPPKGCSHVGLSAGTGLGMSSAVVSNQDEHIAVQGHQQDFELQADDHVENEEMDRDFIDVIENEENPDQHIMVLQQEFFDEENHVAPAAVMQRENVDPENRIDNMQQDVPENRIRRELNEDYDGYMNENNDEDDSYDPKYMLFDEFVSSSGDEDDQPKPSKMSKKVGTDSYDFQIGAANNGCCGESSKYPSIQHKSSSALPDEKMNVNFDDKMGSNNQSRDKRCSETFALPSEKVNVDFDDKKGSNNQSQDKSLSESSSALPDEMMNADFLDKKGSNNQSQDKSCSESSKYPLIQHKSSAAVPDEKINVDFDDEKVSSNQSQDKSCSESSSALNDEMTNVDFDNKKASSNQSQGKSCSESSKYPLIQHKSSAALPDEKMNVDFDNKNGSNNQRQDKSCSESTVLPDENINVDFNDKKSSNNQSQDKGCIESSSALPDEKMNVDFDDEKGSNNQSQDKSCSESSSSLPDEMTNVDFDDKKVSSNQSQDKSCSESSKYPLVQHKSSAALPDEKMNIDFDDEKGSNKQNQDKSCSESLSALPDEKMIVDFDDEKGSNNQSQDKSCSESSSALPDEMMNVDFNNKNCSNNQSEDKSCSESSALPYGKMNVGFDNKKGFNNQSQDKNSTNTNGNSYVKKCAHSKICTNKCSKGFDPINNQSQDECSRNKNGNSYVKKCAHSKICTNKCSKGFDPNQPSTSRDGNCLDCSCVDSDSEMKDVEITVKIEIESDDNGDDNQHRYPVLKPATQKRKYYDRKYLDSMMPDETLFKGPLTRNRKKILHQKIKKEPVYIDSPKVIIVDGQELLNTETGYHFPLEDTLLTPVNPPSYISNVPIKTEPVDDGYENSLNNQDAIIRSQLINPPEENINDVDDKQKIRKHKLRHKGHSSTGNPFNNQNVNKKHRRRNPSVGNVSKAHDKLRAKKHKKHKHKKSKKSSKHSRPSRKKGPITRSRSFRYLYVGRDVVSQGTQATSADIRRSLRRQRNCSLRCKKKSNSICGSSHRKSHNHISARQQMKRPRQTNPNVELQNKSTSTSDPLMEDDAVQTLRLMSETLISITIISCGISDLFIDECLSLRHVEVQACRILKMLQINSCPYLERFNVSQCPKLSLEVVVSETLDVITQANLLVCFEPCMQVYYPSNTEKIIFSKAVQDFNVVLYQDFTSPANEVVQAIAKENLLAWTYITDKMYESPLYQSFYKHWLLNERKKRKKRIRTFYRENRLRYPYGHSLRRIHGIFPLPPSNDTDCGKEGKYQILTNDHIFTSLLENKSWDKGFPTPEACDEYVEDNLLLSMMDTEYTHRKFKLRRKTTAFYIPFSNSN